MSWNARDDLRLCLASIPAAATRYPVETVVVDNHSTDGAPDMVAAEFPDAHLVRLPENTGFSHANNVALENLTAPFALLLNSDAILHPGSLDTLLDFAAGATDAGIIGPKVLNPDGSLQYSCRRFPTFAAGLFRNVYLGKLFPNNRPASDYLMQDFDHDHVRDVDWVSGCALLIQKSAQEQVGPLDAENFFMYCEDMDWCLRAHQANWRVVYFPNARVTHKIGASSDRAADRMIIEHHRAMWRFYQKHQAFFADRVSPPLRPLIPAGILLRVVVRIARRRLINPVLHLFSRKKSRGQSPTTP